jgi:5-methylphenazine-1-carboxylate 1-monooxygenase
MDVLIIGAGIGGLTLALCLHKRGIPARVFEAAPEIRPIGAGLNLLPHAVAEMADLGLAEELKRVSVVTSESIFFNRFGQRIYAEPAGRAAGYRWPQLSLHRAELQSALMKSAKARLGVDRIQLGWRCTGATQTDAEITAEFAAPSGEKLPPQTGSVLIACEGIHSTIRRQLYPSEGEPIYSGVNMWRGVTKGPKFLSGASMVRAGWLATGKMVIYPIRNDVDDTGHQLINWVAEIETPTYRRWDWNRPGNIADFIDAFADWRFDWLDVPAMLRATEPILEYPMVDKDPLPRWSFGRISLLGDAAHPMYPRGSNGAVQSILDARTLADCLAAGGDACAALGAYESKRLPATTEVVLANRARPPDVILREVYERTGDRPFKRIEDVVSAEELAQISNAYKRISGYAKDRRDPA